MFRQSTIFGVRWYVWQTTIRIELHAGQWVNTILLEHRILFTEYLHAKTTSSSWCLRITSLINLIATKIKKVRK